MQAKAAMANGFISYKSKRGTLETKVKSCMECGLELCTGVWCRLGHYEDYTRAIMDKNELAKADSKVSETPKAAASFLKKRDKSVLRPKRRQRKQ